MNFNLEINHTAYQFQVDLERRGKKGEKKVQRDGENGESWTHRALLLTLKS